jgi:integrase/recombinase XerD
MDLIKEFLDNSKNIGKINSNTLEIYRKDIEDFDGFIVGKELIDATSQDIKLYRKIKREIQ